MNPPVCSEFELGCRFVGRLPHGKDLIASIEDFCIESSIQMATFSVIGTVSSATIGVYDQKQQVYVTFTENMPMEVVTCVGNVSLKDQAPVIHTHIVLGDERGKIIGGHLFSETVLYAGEMDLQELVGKPLERLYDRTTGLFLWSDTPNGQTK
ncbi:MAG TPA: PPC domain-containing DNA-binding protein [Desulfobacterales bacterium]|nr:PPC domain-containing DNA-binding protein [Desulfobacterales bacterium]